MTVGRFFVNFTVVLGLLLGMANFLFAQQELRYPGSEGQILFPETNIVAPGIWTNPWFWGAVVAVVIALVILFFALKRRKKTEKDESAAEDKNSTGSTVVGSLGINSIPKQSPCPKCSAPVKVGAFFCTVCGEKLKKAPATAVTLQSTSEQPPTKDGWKFQLDQPPVPKESVVTKSPITSSPTPVVDMGKCSNCGENMPVLNPHCTNCGKIFKRAITVPATTILKSVLVMAIAISAVANAAPTITVCGDPIRPPFVVPDGKPQEYLCVGSGLAGARSIATQDPNVSATIIKVISDEKITLRVVANQVRGARYNAADWLINGQSIGRPIKVKTYEQAVANNEMTTLFLAFAKAGLLQLPAPTAAPATVDTQARKDLADLKKALDALRAEVKAAPASKIPSDFVNRFNSLEKEWVNRMTESQMRDLARQEALSAVGDIDTKIAAAEKKMSEAIDKEKLALTKQADLDHGRLEGRVSALEVSTARDRAVIKATACAVDGDDGGWLGQGPSNRRKRAIRDAAAQAGYQPCPKK